MLALCTFKLRLELLYQLGLLLELRFLRIQLLEFPLGILEPFLNVEELSLFIRSLFLHLLFHFGHDTLIFVIYLNRTFLRCLSQFYLEFLCVLNLLLLELLYQAIFALDRLLEGFNLDALL